jgi:bidirectional [NiFe] hydrogenase diaphorase subunit
MPASAQLRTAAPEDATQLKHSGSETTSDRHVFVVCSGDSCRHAGSNRLLGLLRRQCTHQGVQHDVRISSCKCIGRCGIAPAMVEDGQVLGWVSPRRLKSELTRLGLLSTAS